jgi:hypothetical protein
VGKEKLNILFRGKERQHLFSRDGIRKLGTAGLEGCIAVDPHSQVQMVGHRGAFNHAAVLVHDGGDGETLRPPSSCPPRGEEGSPYEKVTVPASSTTSVAMTRSSSCPTGVALPLAHVPPNVREAACVSPTACRASIPAFALTATQ